MATEGTHARATGRVAVLAVSGLAGLVFVAAATTAGGEDLRPSGEDLGSVVEDRADLVQRQRLWAGALNQQVERLTATAPSTDLLDDLRARSRSLSAVAGTSPSEGPGLRVVLADAPLDVRPDGVDPRVLVIHEQDIRSVVNALWAGGAEAVTLQGQRIISTTSITCVGSTVVIDGVPYAPPYALEAVGDVGGMSFSMAASPTVGTLESYAERYGIVLRVETAERLSLPAHDGSVVLSHATALRPDAPTRED